MPSCWKATESIPRSGHPNIGRCLGSCWPRFSALLSLVPATTQLVDVLPHWSNGRSLGFQDVSVTFETV
jgi:hypothetical protein